MEDSIWPFQSDGSKHSMGIVDDKTASEKLQLLKKTIILNLLTLTITKPDGRRRSMQNEVAKIFLLKDNEDDFCEVCPIKPIF